MPTRYAIATVALPIAQETFDYFRWNVGKDIRFTWKEPLHDIVTYQGAWSVYFAKRGQWHWAALTLIGVTGFTYWWNFER